MTGEPSPLPLWLQLALVFTLPLWLPAVPLVSAWRTRPWHRHSEPDTLPLLEFFG
jgi:hypothetical protein